MRDPQERLRDVLEAIERIERYAARGKAAFERDELIQVWFVRHLQVIGEAVRALPQEVRERAPDVPWSKIVGMRHILVHDYFDIDTELLWQVIEGDLQELKQKVRGLLDRLEKDAARAGDPGSYPCPSSGTAPSRRKGRRRGRRRCS